jgi:hypothetical protein
MQGLLSKIGSLPYSHKLEGLQEEKVLAYLGSLLATKKKDFSEYDLLSML